MQVRARLAALERRYAQVPKAPPAHADLGDWWALYDYGLEAVAGWAPDHKHPYPGELGRRAGLPVASQLLIAPLHVTGQSNRGEQAVTGKSWLHAAGTDICITLQLDASALRSSF